MKKYLNELSKISSINTQLQNKLGEITIWINNPNNIIGLNNADIKEFIFILQSFLCHKYYLDFMSLKPFDNSTYDNCMNLILIVLAKICKISPNNGEYMIKFFIEHINNHLECFNYIISFYRLCITSPQLKICGKNEELFFYLFQLYKKLYSVNLEYENKSYIKDLNSIFKSGIVKKVADFDGSQDHKYLTEQYLQISTDRPINKILNNENSINYNLSYNIMNSNSFGENFFQKNLKFNNIQYSNINKSSFSNIINSNSKANILSRTDRKINNNANKGNIINQHINNNSSINNPQTNDLNNYTSKIINHGRNNQNVIINNNLNLGGGGLNTKETQTKSIKPNIPTLKFPLDKTQTHQKFSLIRSSHRNDFSKSGDGSSTTTTKYKIFTNKLAEGSSINRHFTQDVLILEPKEKLKELALQLGESCLATDFTSLINKKRSFEIEKYKKRKDDKKRMDDDDSLYKYNNLKGKNYSKRNNNTNKHNIGHSECQSSNKLNNYIEKINSLNENNSISINNASNKNDSFNYNIPSKYDSKRSINNKNNNISENLSNMNVKDKSTYSIQSYNNNYQNFKNFIKIREILTNFIISALREYSEDEIRNLKIDIFTIFNYLSLPSMENLQNKTEKKKIEIIEQMKFILDREKDLISYGNFLYLPEKIEISKKKFAEYTNSINNVRITNKQNTVKNNNELKESKKSEDNFNIFESLLSITFEEDNNCPLILKNENEALYDILSLYSNNIENELKKIILYQNYKESLELNLNGIKLTKFNFGTFDKIVHHIDPFLEIIINRLKYILLSSEAYNCYTNNNLNSQNSNFGDNNEDNYIMKLLKNYFSIINYYISTSKNRLLKLYIMKFLKDILLYSRSVFLIIFNRLTNMNYYGGSSSNCMNNTFKNSNMTLDNNFTERYDFRIPPMLIEAFCTFIQLITEFINCFDDNKLLNQSKYLNDNFISNNDWLNIVKFIFDYLFLSNLNIDYTLRINESSNPLYKYEKSTSNSQRLGNIYFTKCSVCSILKDDNISKFNENLSEIYKLRIKQLLMIIKLFYESNVYYQKIIKTIENISHNENNDTNLSNSVTPIIHSINDADHTNNKKYWNNSINNYLYYLNMLLNSKSGSVFDFFICSNGGNFLFSKIKLSIIFTHYNLTKNLLILQESALNFPMNYSFIINEMTSLDVIRLHYISFIKLYNKNVIFNTNISEVSSIIATSENLQKKKTIKAFVKDIHNDQNLLNILLNLCKMHLRCLFVLSKNRNADVTNKFFQLKIVDYFTHEIQLEHEVAEKVYKLNQFYNSNKNAKNDIKISNDKNKNLILSKLDLGKLNMKQEKKIDKIPLQLNNINEASNEDLGKKNNDSENNSKKKDDNGEEDDEYEEDEDDFDEIPLVAPNNNACSYKNKIPKLNMLSSSFNDNEISSPSLQNIKEDNKNQNFAEENIEEKSEVEVVKEEEKKDIKKSETNNNSGPKIKLNLNLALCKTKSDKNQKLQEEIEKKDKNEINLNIKDEKCKEENKNDDNISKKNEIVVNKKSEPKIQLKLNLDLCKTKSNKNDLLKMEILNNNNNCKDKISEKIEKVEKIEKIEKMEKTESKENNINNNDSLVKNSNIKNNSANINIRNVNNRKLIQMPKLNLKINKLMSKDSNKILGAIKNANLKMNINNNSNKKNPNNNNNENLISRESTNRNNLNKDPSIATKIRVEIENHLKEKYKLFYQKAINEGFTEGDLSNVNQFYLKERNNRVLYQDPEIQVLIISLLFSLIITPSRGTLEELYCSVFPYENNKLNILYIIHHHLNRDENYNILPLLLKFVAQIHPFGAGQRLLKLLCKHFFDASFYSNWEKIGGGQFGTVYQCSTGLTEPNIVAIKKTELEQNIFSPCHLFDIFTEVTALEALRLENCVTQLYDYGCDDEYYYIVMKRYPISLKKWRIQQKQSLKEMLPTYLSIFKDILQAVQIIHNNNTTHYDLKCDNIVLDFLSNNKDNTYDIEGTDENENDSICIRVADFGECRMFLNEVDEHCTRSRGTDVIKSPEMLKHFGYQIRKEDDNFDRRKKVGTTRSSDIWSLGCLFYELLTGNFLFEEIQDNYLEFMYKIDKSSINDLLTEKKLSLLDNNPYLIDFLKFMLIKNQTYRPNIDTVIKRFEHVYALLEGGTGVMIPKQDLDILQYNNKIYNESYFEASIENCDDMITNEDNSWDNSFDKNLLFNNIKLIPEILKLTKDIFIAQYDYIEETYCSNMNNISNQNIINNTKNINQNNNKCNNSKHIINNNQSSSSEDIINLLLSLGITHIISFTSVHKKSLKNKFLFFNLNEDNSLMNKIEDEEGKIINNKTPFEYIFKTMDYIRHCMIHKGKILFIDDYFYNNVNNKPNCLIRSILLIIFAHFLNQSAYDTYTYLNNKLLFYNLPMTYYLPSISNWIMNQNIICNYLSSFPIFRCFCGACQLIMRRDFSIKQKTVCNCHKSDGNNILIENDCPSNGCSEYIEFCKKNYEKNYNSLIWGNINFNNFYLKIDSNEEKHYKQIITFSDNLENNIIEHCATEKYDNKSSLSISSGRKKIWKVYKCKICYAWMFGQSTNDIQILLNNEFNLVKNIENRKKLIKGNELKDISLQQIM